MALADSSNPRLASPVAARDARRGVAGPGPATRLNERLGPVELRRRLWHIGPGLLPFLLWNIPHADPISPTLRWIVVGTTVAIATAIFLKFHLIQRRGENGRLGQIAGYAGAVLGTVLLFPRHLELGMAVLAILAFGDGMATLFGLVVGGPRLAWNRAKTWAGTASFVLIGGAAASVIYWREAQPAVSFATALACGMAGAFVAGIAESLPSRINDNIRVGLAAALALAAMHGWLVGW